MGLRCWCLESLGSHLPVILEEPLEWWFSFLLKLTLASMLWSERLESCTLLFHMSFDTAAMENSVDLSQNGNYRDTL